MKKSLRYFREDNRGTWGGARQVETRKVCLSSPLCTLPMPKRCNHKKQAGLPALPAFLMVLMWVLFSASFAHAHEFRGYAALQAQGFTHGPLWGGQRHSGVSLVLEPEYYHAWKCKCGDSSIAITPFLRLDSADPERSHFDMREFNYLLATEKWELTLGLSKVFWGVVESLHLVDVINQTDLVESPDMEEKLGQPMVHLSVPRGAVTFDLFVLPWFRERTFPGVKGRLRSGLTVDTDRAVYESDAKDGHVDFGARVSGSIGNWDIGLSHFQGTGREPTLLPGLDASGGPVLVPYYEQVGQSSLDAQLVAGRWLLKHESIYRTGQGSKDFFAAVSGYEYTRSGIFGTGMDLSFLTEWLYDERGEAGGSPFENDLMLALRFALNDAAGTAALVSLIEDLNGEGRVLTLEASRRIRERWTAKLEAFLVLESEAPEFFHYVRDDDYVSLEIAYWW